MKNEIIARVKNYLLESESESLSNDYCDYHDDYNNYYYDLIIASELVFIEAKKLCKDFDVSASIFGLTKDLEDDQLFCLAAKTIAKCTDFNVDPEIFVGSENVAAAFSATFAVASRNVAITDRYMEERKFNKLEQRAKRWLNRYEELSKCKQALRDEELGREFLKWLQLKQGIKKVGEIVTQDGAEYLVVDNETIRDNKQLIIEDKIKVCTSHVTDMYGMFEGAEAFNGDLSDWDTSNVTDMAGVFINVKYFNGDLSGWDTSRVTDMSWMFAGAEAFNGDLSGWDTRSVTDMRFMFDVAKSFNGDLSDWDTSSVTDMRGMFYRAKSFNGDLSDWGH